MDMFQMATCIHKVKEQQLDKQSRGVQKAYKLLLLAILLLNQLYKFR